MAWLACPLQGVLAFFRRGQTPPSRHLTRLCPLVPTLPLRQYDGRGWKWLGGVHGPANIHRYLILDRVFVTLAVEAAPFACF